MTRWLVAALVIAALAAAATLDVVAHGPTPAYMERSHYVECLAAEMRNGESVCTQPVNVIHWVTETTALVYLGPLVTPEEWEEKLSVR